VYLAFRNSASAASIRFRLVANSAVAFGVRYASDGGKKQSPIANSDSHLKGAPDKHFQD